MKILNHKSIQIILLVILIIGMTAIMAEAQCPMCRMSGETNLKEGGTAAAGLNKGIIYLLTIPYILVSTVGYLWWRNRKMVREQEIDDEIRGLLEPF